MNSKAIQANSDINTGIIPGHSGRFTRLDNFVKTFFAFLADVRISAAQKQYLAKRKRQEISPTHQDILRSLPIEQKLGLGMYRYLD